MHATPHFRDRYDAGHRLAGALHALEEQRPLFVLGLPRGGVPVASVIAEALDAPMDALIVRRIPVPAHADLALGAVASGGIRVLNPDVIDGTGLPLDELARTLEHEERELERSEANYRRGRPFPNLAGAAVILVDDGAASGSSIRAAAEAVRLLGPRNITAAVPVASRLAAEMIRPVVDRVVCIIEPEPFLTLDRWYADFAEVSDAEVRVLLDEAHRRWRRAAPLASV
ncbi:MAG TPA: phosphoribosyltransferase family protein [Gemmatimonadaceae bacterium]|nr:phosphoribosyltransferase family protein [Gemmatimonadaceae bacterium]